MNGRFLLDTNAVVFLLKGNVTLQERIEKAGWIGISVISCIEYLSFPGLSMEDASLFNIFVDKVEVVSLDWNNRNLVDITISLRKVNNIKLPDAIIAATAMENNAVLVTADRRLLSLKDLNTLEC